MFSVPFGFKSNNIDMWANPYVTASAAVTIYISQKLSVNITKDNQRRAL